VEILLAIGFLIVSVGLSHTAFRFAKLARRERQQEWRSEWRSLEPERRKRIVRAVRRGEPVRGSADAELALYAIAQVERVRRALRPIELFAWPILVATLVWAIHSGSSAVAIALGIALPLLALGSVLSEWQRRRLVRSADATRRILDAR
jgi:hypothetical protein